MEKQYPVYTLKNECNDCYKCIRGCHIKAIRIQSGSASVINEKCIACGHCVTICPAGAKKVRNDIDKVKALLLTGKKVYVSLATSWAGVYDITPNTVYVGATIRGALSSRSPGRFQESPHRWSVPIPSL